MSQVRKTSHSVTSKYWQLFNRAFVYDSNYGSCYKDAGGFHSVTIHVLCNCAVSFQPPTASAFLYLPNALLPICLYVHMSIYLSAYLSGGSASSTFSVSCGTKQGCILAPLLFSVFFAMLLHVAFHNCTAGIPLTFRTDRNLFNLRKLQSQTKTTLAIIRELLFADDCALAAHTLKEAQMLLDRFVAACSRFGLKLCSSRVQIALTLRQWSLLTTPLFLLQTPSATLEAAFSIRDPLMKKLQLACLRQALLSADSESGCGMITVSAQTRK